MVDGNGASYDSGQSLSDSEEQGINLGRGSHTLK